MDDHTIIERKLKTDIIQKNLVRRSLQQKLDSVRRWAGLLEKGSKKPQKKRYQDSIDRYQGQIGLLKNELLKQNEALEARILKEMNYSEEEVKNFKAELNKESKALEKLKQALNETTEKAGKVKEDNELQLKRRRLEKLLNEELKKIDASEKEIVSEERDKVLFTRELKRIALEKELYRPSS